MGEFFVCLVFNVFCCLQYLLKCSFDVVKRWVNEVQEVVFSDNIMVQVRCEWSSVIYNIQVDSMVLVRMDSYY